MMSFISALTSYYSDNLRRQQLLIGDFGV